MPAGILDENVDLRYTIKLDVTAATVRLKRFNSELMKSQALLAGLSGKRIAGAGAGVHIGGTFARGRGVGGNVLTRGIMAQSAAIGVLSSKMNELASAGKAAGIGLAA